MDESSFSMADQNPNNQKTSDSGQEAPQKWDYTSSKQTLFTGAMVVGLNLLVVIAVLLDRSIPAVHTFFTGKTM